MKTYFDKAGDVHAADDFGMVDVNFDAMARAVLKWGIEQRRAKRRRRLTSTKGSR